MWLGAFARCPENRVGLGRAVVSGVVGGADPMPPAPWTRSDASQAASSTISTP